MLNSLSVDLKQHYLHAFPNPAADKASALRQEALHAFNRHGFPTPALEAWKYTNPEALLAQALGAASPANLSLEAANTYFIEDLEADRLVFFNGHFQVSLSLLSNPALRVMPLRTAFHSPDPEIQALMSRHYGQYARTEGAEAGFAAFNTAFAQEGLLIYVPAGQVIDRPVAVYFLTQADTPLLLLPRLLVVAEEESQLRLMEIYRGHNPQTVLSNGVTELVVGSKARVHYYKIQHEGENASHVGLTEVHQGRDSYFSAHTFTLGGRFVRNNLHLRLDAENAEAHMYGLSLLDGKQFCDNHTLADHRKPHTFSNELYKGVLDGQSTGVFNGKVYVHPDAQKTNAYQSSRNLILSPQATLNAKPELEIYADDVKCSHGAAVGMLDENMLFYLRTRGIPEDQARALLLLAFANQVLEGIEEEALNSWLEAQISHKLLSQ